MQPAWLIAIAAAMALAGCRRSAQAQEVAQADRAAVEDARARVRDLDQALDDVEARIWSNRSTSRLYAELAARHRRVSAIACSNAQMHAEGMARTSLENRQGRAELARRRRLEAAKSSAAGPTGD